MKIKIEIDCDNAAFEDDAGGEIARILRKIAEDAQDFPTMESLDNNVTYKLRDINGNTVGSCEVEA